MVKYKELVNIIQSEIAKHPNWAIAEVTGKYIAFFKKPNKVIEDANYFWSGGHILDSNIFHFIIKRYNSNDIIKKQCFNSFNDYNETLQTIYDQTHHLQHTISIYDYSPFNLLKNPEVTLQNLINQCDLIENDILKDIVKANEKKLEFDIDHFDSLDTLTNILTAKLSERNIEFTISETVQNHPTHSTSLFYKGLIITVAKYFTYTLCVKSNNTYDLFIDYHGKDILSIENATLEKVQGYLQNSINLIRNIKPEIASKA